MLFYVQVLLKVSLGWIFAYWITDYLFEKLVYLSKPSNNFYFFPMLLNLFLNQGLCKLTHMQSDCPGTGSCSGPTRGPEFIQNSSHHGPLACLFSPNFLKKPRSIDTAFLYATVFKGKERCSDLAHTWCCVILLKYMLPVGERKFKQFRCFNCVQSRTYISIQYPFYCEIKMYSTTLGQEF